VRIFNRSAWMVMALSLVGLSAAAQEKKITEKDVPAAVMSAFRSAYPHATIKGLAKERENGKLFYEIESMDDKTPRDILYHPDGSVAEIEEGIAASDLPADAQQAIQKYPGAVVVKAERVTKGDKIAYEVSARQRTRRISLEFDSSGKLLKSHAR
jgi:hypothetical protein